MAWGQKKSGGRKEPQFGLAASLSELRLGPQDRVARDEAPNKSSKRKAVEPEHDPPRERKKASRASGKRKGKARAGGGLYRLFYWGAVLGLWGPIAVIGVVIWVGAHL